MEEKGEKGEDRAVGSEKEQEPEIEIVEAEVEPEKAKEEKAVKVKKRKDELKIIEEIPVKVRPHIDKETRALLELRRARKSKKPPFLRQEWFRYKRLGMKWRRPQGQQSKQRRHFAYRPNVVSIGYGSPAAVRFHHPSGFTERLVHNLRELEGVNPKKEAVRIAGSVGNRKRIAIINKADDLEIRVLNRNIRERISEKEEEKKAPAETGKDKREGKKAEKKEKKEKKENREVKKKDRPAEKKTGKKEGKDGGKQ